jgi:V/A-type H+-transporting ATPase subunit D
LDKKRNILVRELMSRIDKAKKINDEIQVVFSEAYEALQDANISMGISVVQQIGFAIPEEESIRIRDHSVMGVEIPVISVNEKNMQPYYGFRMTNGTLDLARKKFEEAKILSVQLAEIENSIYRLAKNIRRTMKRTNALKNIIIPKYESICSTIENVLEEKEREEFSRLKIIKRVTENKDKF